MEKLRLLWIYLGILKAVQYLLFYIFNKRNKTFITIDESFQLFCKHLNKKYTCKRSLLNNFINIYFEINEQNYVMKMRVNSSDFLVWEQIFIREEYKKPIEIIKQKINISERINIIDCGANIGSSPAYFNTFFKDANIIALEPFKSSYEILERNLNINNINHTSILGALWSKRVNLDIVRDFRDKKEWSVRTIESFEGDIKAFTLNDIVEMNKLQFIDILKVDIEGGEFEAFLNSKLNKDCLKKIKAVIMEIHDEAGNRERLYRCINKEGFTMVELGELTLFLNKSFLLN